MLPHAPDAAPRCNHLFSSLGKWGPNPSGERFRYPWKNKSCSTSLQSLMRQLQPFDEKMPKIPLDRHLLALSDAELEKFVREWTTHKSEYVEVERFTGPGDMGRDVVGYLSKKRHEGPWHNFQCKQY